MNKVVLIGRLTKDPELRYTPSNNTSVCQFTVAVDRRFKSEGQPQADFIQIVAWRQTAEFVAKYFTKGSRIAITGSIQTRTWDDNSGNRRYITEVVADEVEFCESKRQDGNNQGNMQQGYSGNVDRTQQTYAAPQSAGPDSFDEGYFAVDDEGIPF